MAYKKSDLEKQALQIITNDPSIVFDDDVFQLLPCGKTTYYGLKLNESNVLKDALTKNRVAIKRSLRSKWHESDNATVQIALYKLICTDDEAERLNGSKQKLEHTGNINFNFEQAVKEMYGAAREEDGEQTAE